MKKMMLLAAMVALAAMMLAAAPALAQADPDPPACDKENPPENNPNCDEDNDGDNDFDFLFCDLDNDGNDDGNHDGDDDGDDDCFVDITDREVFRDIGNVEVAPVFDISQETEQDCDTGGVSQPIEVTGGDNSIQTVGLQPTANTGCAQNATGILDVNPVVAGFGGDTAINNEDNGLFNDGRVIVCDEDGDGNKDEDCEDFDFDDGNNGDNGDRDVFRFGGDRFVIDGAQDGGDTEVDSNASIDVSPTQSIEGGGNLTQTAIAIGELKDGVPWWLTS